MRRWPILECMGDTVDRAPRRAGAGTLAAPPLTVGLATEDWTGDARFHEYSAAVDPVGSGTTSRIPLRRFPSPWHEHGPTVVDTGSLRRAGDARTPRPGRPCWPVSCPSPRATVWSSTPSPPAASSTACADAEPRPRRRRGWRGDVAGRRRRHLAGRHAGPPRRSGTGAVLYHVDDSPLLAYLGVVQASERASPLPASTAPRPGHGWRWWRLTPEAAGRSRVAVLLGNARNDQTLTATHTLWAMLGVLPAGQVQRPHRHQSIALDLIVDCDPGCYTLVGRGDRRRRGHRGPRAGGLGAGRCLRHASRAMAQPPQRVGRRPRTCLPVQDAGLHTYLRTLDIRFTAP